VAAVYAHVAVTLGMILDLQIKPFRLAPLYRTAYQKGGKFVCAIAAHRLIFLSLLILEAEIPSRQPCLPGKEFALK
jgi:hypothetical protein